MLERAECIRGRDNEEQRVYEPVQDSLEEVSCGSLRHHAADPRAEVVHAVDAAVNLRTVVCAVGFPCLAGGAVAGVTVCFACKDGFACECGGGRESVWWWAGAGFEGGLGVGGGGG